ncbi:V-type ATP synthase subunit I [Clostridium tetani]|uniref:V-type ATP synthase subunit I n=1 Tax=Clostridium tetani TaxID=1513 RepID=UPI000512D481|nr:V-type ATP synthase subunit I [Clostridium tetani]AVP54420.1 V-type ATP synthase subunit I [Clostridium tetani]KGI42406.1 ATP synthase subunit I [Clostridium tetani]RXI72035.1 V-type ATP synthase subunit I [Clostridium tetani]BDR86301.1 V-type ATP synthase subunit I [Clostridium tetani]
MAIVKMNKFSLLVFQSEKKQLLERLQNFSKVQFIDLKEETCGDEEKQLLDYLDKDSSPLEVSELESKKYKVKFALDILKRYHEEKGGIKESLKGKKILSYEELKNLEKKSQWEKIYESIKEKEDKLNILNNEISKLNSDIETLIPWRKLDVSFQELQSLRNCVAFIGAIPKRVKEDFRVDVEDSFEQGYVEEISEVKEDLNLLLIVHKDFKNEAEDILRKYAFSKTTLNYKESPIKFISSAKEKIEDIRGEKESIAYEIKSYLNYLEDLKIIYEYFENELNKANVSENFLKTDRMVAINGWLPEENKKELQEEIEKITQDYYIDFIEPEEGEDVPIELKNNSLVKPFESITSMYSLPKYNEIDPTPLLMPFYLIFFGMMLSDAGYGLVMFIGTLLALRFLPLEEGPKNFVKLFFYLSIPTMFWGIMYGSFFTGAIDIPAVWMKPEDNANLLLFASIAFGLIQIFIGLGIKGYLYMREGKYLDAFYDVGLWYITLVTVILFLAGSFGNVEALKGSMNIIKYIMFAAMIGLVLTQGRENKNIGARLGAGLYGLYGITGYIGDFVSYSRLMALGLATGFIGGALNLIISYLGTGVKAWIFGPLIFVIGHMFNLLINALGAYVHTSRLQYVEYFGKFYEGGGKPFTPFKYTNKFIKIKTE